MNVGRLKQLKRSSLSTTNDSQPLTVVIKNFVLDATGVLDLRDTLNQALNRQVSVFIRLCTLSLLCSAIQNSTIMLNQHFVESCFNDIVLTLRRPNAESVYYNLKCIL